GELRRGVAHPVAQLADVINLVLAGRVDLLHIQRLAAGDLQAVVALATAVTILRVEAAQRLRENARDTRLARTTWTGEQVGMGQALAADRVAQNLRRLLLADQLAKSLAAVLAVKSLHAPRVDYRLGVDARI